MSQASLAELNLPKVNRLMSLVQQLDEFDNLRGRLSNPAQVIQSARSQQNNQASQDVEAVIRFGKETVDSAVAEQLEGFFATVDIVIADVREAVQDLEALNSQAETALRELRDSCATIREIGTQDGVVAFAKRAFDQYASDLLQPIDFDINGEKLKVRFQSALGSQFLFRDSANLSAELLYEAVTIRIGGVFLKRSDNTFVPEFTQSTSVNIDESSLIQIVTEAIPEFDIGGIESLELDTTASPPKVRAELRIGGFQGFDAFRLNAQFEVDAEGDVELIGAQATLGNLVVPIVPTVFSMTDITLGIADLPQTGKNLSAGTSIVPSADLSGKTMRFRLNVFFPLRNLGQQFDFGGRLVLGDQFNCGEVTDGRFQISPFLFKARVQIPGSSNSPFGGSDVFRVEGSVDLDETGLFLGREEPVSVALYKHIKGKCEAEFRFNGAGFVRAMADIEAFGAEATFRADWGSRFRNLRVEATAKVKINVAGLAAFTVSASLRATSDGEINVKAEIMGVRVNDKIRSSNLQSFLESFVEDAGDAVTKLIFERGGNLLKDLDPTNKNSALRRGLAELDVFENFEPAKKMRDRATQKAKEAKRDCIDNPNLGKCIEHATPKFLVSDSGFGLNDTLDLTSGLFRPNHVKEVDFQDLIDLIKNSFPLEPTIRKLYGLSVSDRREVDEEHKNPLYHISSQFHAQLDMVQVNFNDVDPEEKSLSGAIITFFVAGNSSTQRKGREVRSSFAHWGHIRFRRSGSNINASIAFAPPTADGDPSIQNSDASLLHAVHQTTLAIESALRETISNIIIVSPVGAVPSIRLKSGQPGAGSLPTILPGELIPLPIEGIPTDFGDDEPDDGSLPGDFTPNPIPGIG